MPYGLIISMQINVTDPIVQTYLFSLIFFTLLFLSVRKKEIDLTLSKEVTTDLKGFAILAIVFSHIGYFLSTDDRFLFPLSILAGAGVNLFLFLSGFGLTVSAIKRPVTVFGFYKKRLSKLFIPLWITISVLLLSDLIFLHKSYSLETLIQSYLGFFPSADLFSDLDSPLWYFTLIFFYYLIFPLLFWKKFPYLSAPFMLLITFYVLDQQLLIKEPVLNLYKLHFISFPLGVFFAEIIYDENLTGIMAKAKKIYYRLNLSLISIPFFLAVFFYTSFNSGVGLSKVMEQTISLITTLCAVFLFLIIHFKFRLFSFLGKYSYEIYLVHWPILAYYGFLYLYLPAFLATIIYLGIFIVLGIFIKRVQSGIFKLLRL